MTKAKVNRIDKNDKMIEKLRADLSELYVDNYQLAKADREEAS